MSLGPVELIVLKYYGDHFTGVPAAMIQSYVDSGLIRIIDGLLVRKGAAVEEEANTSRPPGAGRQEIDARQPAALDLKTALLEGLAPARLPRRLAARFDLTARNRPALLVAGLQDQQPPEPVEDQRPSRCGNPGRPNR